MSKITALAQWFGSNRMMGPHVGNALRGCSWVGVPFAGGMAELKHIKANVMLVGDLHRHVINLAQAVKINRASLVARLDSIMFHPDELFEAQIRCVAREVSKRLPSGDLDWAVDYFVCNWMGRGSSGGTEKEFDGNLSVRWKSGGGDSCVRFRSAVKALADFEVTARKCTFVCIDAFAFINEALERDNPQNGIYVDAPWPGAGDAYKHTFTEAQQRELAFRLSLFDCGKVVVRYGDHPLIRELYPERDWDWKLLGGRTQANESAGEVLLTRKSR